MRGMLRKFGWFVLIWTLSVTALAVLALLLRWGLRQA